IPSPTYPRGSIALNIPQNAIEQCVNGIRSSYRTIIAVLVLSDGGLLRESERRLVTSLQSTMRPYKPPPNLIGLSRNSAF
ncbi:hypothetical protein A0H81_13784, partial [Grifola frondosa]